MSETLRCAFCTEVLDFLTIPEREAHYEHHFLNENTQVVDFGAASSTSTILAPHANSSKSTNTNRPNDKEHKTPSKVWKLLRENDLFWYPEQTTIPPSNYTPGLIPLIRKGLVKGHSRQLIRRAVLCTQKAVHIHREPWDVGWGCGYRNFLMACAVLMSQDQQPMYLPLLDAPLPPSVRNLQTWIESAWKEGFDPEGCKDLKKLAGTSKWVGTADLWVAFSYRGIPAKLVDFDLRHNPRGLDLLIDWVVDYFSVQESTPPPKDAFEFMKVPQVTVTEKMPLILQHDGHSRTIIGYEIDKNGMKNLLAFEPGFRPPAELRIAARKEFAQLRSTTEGFKDVKRSASSSSLKRKRSDEMDGNMTHAADQSSTNKLSPLKVTKLNAENKELDLYTMMRKFRLDVKNLSKKKEYQVLYFPMTAPLTDYERCKRKEVTSTKFS